MDMGTKSVTSEGGYRLLLLSWLGINSTLHRGSFLFENSLEIASMLLIYPSPFKVSVVSHFQTGEPYENWKHNLLICIHSILPSAGHILGI